MARNIRNITVKATAVTYGTVRNGKLTQEKRVCESASHRKIMRELADFEGVDPSALVIINTQEVAQTYRVLDMVGLLEMAVREGMAEYVSLTDVDDNGDDTEEDADGE